MKRLLSILILTLLFSCSASDDGSTEEEQFCGVYEGDVFLAYDDAIIEFGRCNYTEITGDLIILESSFAFTITDLSPLSSITKVGGLLRIGGLRELKNLNGLHNIESADRLAIYYAEALENLDDLDKLQTNSIQLSNNYALQNIDGLDMESDTIDGIGITNSPLLTSLNCFSNIKFISNGFGIEGCHSLTNLEGLNNVESIGEFYNADCCGSLVIKNNFFLESLEGLNNLTHVKGDIFIYGNTYLSDFCALKNLFLIDGHIEGDYEIWDNLINPSQDVIVYSNYCN